MYVWYNVSVSSPTPYLMTWPGQQVARFYPPGKVKLYTLTDDSPEEGVVGQGRSVTNCDGMVWSRAFLVVRPQRIPLLVYLGPPLTKSLLYCVPGGDSWVSWQSSCSYSHTVIASQETEREIQRAALRALIGLVPLCTIYGSVVVCMWLQSSPKITWDGEGGGF